MTEFHGASGSEVEQLRRYLRDDLPEYARLYADAASASSKLAGDAPDDDAYSVDSPGAAWWSDALFSLRKMAGSYTPRHTGHELLLRARFSRAAKAWGIASDTAKLQTKIASGLANDMLPEYCDADFGLVRVVAGKTERSYPMVDGQCVGLASSKFARERGALAPEERRQLASSILAKAAEFEVPEDAIDRRVMRSAGRGLSTASKLAYDLRDRAVLSSDESARAVLVDLADKVAGMDAAELMSASDELVDAVDAWDKLAGCAPAALAEDLVYAMTDSEAEEFTRTCVDVGGVPMRLTKLASVPSVVYAAVLGTDFVASVGGVRGTIDQDKLARALVDLSPADSASLLLGLRERLSA